MVKISIQKLFRVRVVTQEFQLFFHSFLTNEAIFDQSGLLNAFIESELK